MFTHKLGSVCGL